MTEKPRTTRLAIDVRYCYSFPEDTKDIPIKLITDHLMDKGWLHDNELCRKIDCEESHSISDIKLLTKWNPTA